MFRFLTIIILLLTSCETIIAFKKNGFKKKQACPTYSGADQLKYDKEYYKCKPHSKIKIHEPK
jgi:hypothetical protein